MPVERGTHLPETHASIPRFRRSPLKPRLESLTTHALAVLMPVKKRAALAYAVTGHRVIDSTDLLISLMHRFLTCHKKRTLYRHAVA